MNWLFTSLIGITLLVSAPIYSYGATTLRERPFALRYSVNTRGNLTLIGNSNLSCAPDSNSIGGATTCVDARAGFGADVNNNDFLLTYSDVDDISGTFNSTAATLSLPAGAQVIFAGLYWGAFSDVDDTLGLNPDRHSVLFKTPALSTYTRITATVLNDIYIPGQGNAYQGFVDVTSHLTEAGNGDYFVANLTALSGPNRYAGWTLVVAYEDATQPQRNLVVYDGFLFDTPSITNLSLPLTGFLTPPFSPVKTSIGLVVYDGDRGGSSNDKLLLNGTAITDAANPAGNIYNSTISNNGVPVLTRNRDYSNTFGIDIDMFNADNTLPTSATSATVVISASQKVLPGVVTFATVIYRPTMSTQVVVKDLNGGEVNPGDILEYSISVTNTGDLPAQQTTVENPIPTNTQFVAGSLSIVSSPTSGQTGQHGDASGDDFGEVTSNAIKFRLGDGATPGMGGNLAVSASAQVRFRVRVNTVVPSNAIIHNVTSSQFAASTPGGLVPLSDSLQTRTAIQSHNILLPIVRR